MTKLVDFPKIESPFIREMINKNYVVTPNITENMNWVFEDMNVLAVEKIHGTCCAIVIENGVVIAMFNRTNRIPFIGGTLSKALTEGVNNALAKDRFTMMDGIYWGELIGPKVQKNDYQLEEHEWLPFEWMRTHLAYNSWHKYPKTFENINNWFMNPIEEGGIFSLFMKKKGVNQSPEGVVFTHPETGQMAKLRRDMFSDYKGPRHNDHTII